MIPTHKKGGGGSGLYVLRAQHKYIAGKGCVRMVAVRCSVSSLFQSLELYFLIFLLMQGVILPALMVCPLRFLWIQCLA